MKKAPEWVLRSVVPPPRIERGFVASYHFGFRRHLRVRGLDYAFNSESWEPSSLYTFP